MTIRAAAAAVCAEIHERDGRVTREAVVEAARPKNSPLHHLFDWDNKTAGDKWRLHQAGTLIRIVRDELPNNEGEPKYVRTYTAARNAGREEPGYLKTEEVLASPVSEAILLRSLQREIGRLRAKYGHLREFGAIVRGELGELAG